MNIRFQIEGFSPSQEIRTIASVIAEKIHLSAPSDSALDLVVRKSRGAVFASCRIASKAGVFMAHAINDSAVMALKEMEGNVLAQLKDWLKTRFEKNRRSRAQR